MEPSTELAPYKQGELDWLCSLYAIINGIRLVMAPRGGLARRQARILFKRGMEYLEDNEHGYIVRVGLDSEPWHDLACHLFKHASAKEIGDFQRSKRALRTLPDDSAAAVAEIESAVTKGTPVAILIEKPWNHYTVVSGIEGDKWIVFDSKAYKSINRNVIGMDGSGLRYVLHPRAIFFRPK